MDFRVIAATFSVVLLLAGYPHAKEPAKAPEAERPLAKSRIVTIGVMEIKGVGIEQEKVDVIADIIAELISKLGDVRVVSKADIQSMLNLEKQKRLAGCDDKECFAEVAGALGMPWMVTGNIGRFGESFVINLKLIDVRNAHVVGRTTRKVSGDEEDLLDALPDATRELLETAVSRLPVVPTVTVASRKIQLLEESPSAVSVYTREDLRSSGATDLADFLRRVPGLDIYRLKPGWPLVGARAFTSMSNNLILPVIDGREALVEFTGFTIWSGLSIDIEEVERLELIRGPGSALYGANAFAGVVSITTVSSQPASQSDVYLRAGEVGQHRLFGRVRDKLELKPGILSYGVGIGFEEKRSPSDTRNRAIKNFRSHGYLSYRTDDDTEVSLHGGFTRGEGSFFHNMGDWRQSDSLEYWLMLKGIFAFGANIELHSQIYYSRMSTDQFFRTQLSAYDIWIADFPDNHPLSHNLDGKLQLDWQILDNLLFISGVNLRYTTLDWDKILLAPYDEARGAIFTQVQWRPWEELQITGGLRLDLNTLTDSALSPRIAAIFLPWKSHSFRLSYGLAFRKPSAYETKAHVEIEDYNPATPEIVEVARTQIGNEQLRNEKVHSFEAGWRASFLDNRLRASVDLFVNLYRDTINFVIDIPYSMGLPDIPNSTFRFENLGAEANAFGGEAEIGWRVHDDVHLWYNFGVRHVVNKDTGERMPGEPVFRTNIGGRYTPESGLTADIALHYVTEYEMPLIDPGNVFDNPKSVVLGNELLLVGRVGYRFTVGEYQTLEAGLNIVTPLGNPFREYPGAPILQWHRLKYSSDFAGEVLTRLVSLYLHCSF
jgi:outer membrane receptor protein involved in Fe transport